MLNFFYKSLVIAVISLPFFASAATTTDISASPPVAIGIHVFGSQIAYGDLVIYDDTQGIYALSQYADDPRVYGVIVQDAPLVYLASSTDVPVVRTGTVLVNVTLENGPIKAGDNITASSIPGMAMRADSSAKHAIGVAAEAFLGSESTTTVSLKGKTIAAGTIAVKIGTGLSSVLGTGTGSQGGAGQECGTIACTLLAKINAAPLVTLMRYIIAAVVTMGSLYLAFRTFMADAVNGVISVGRNPRAKTAIQAMVVFNAVLAGVIALSGLGVGLLILFIQL